MSKYYRRIINSDEETLSAGSEYCYGCKTTKQAHIDYVDETNYKNVVYRCGFRAQYYDKINYPLKVQVVKKRKTKNGRIVRKIVYEKIIEYGLKN